MAINVENIDRTKYGKTILQASHNVVDTGLFDDAGLIDALDRHPAEYLDITTQGSFGTCNRGDANADEILNAVKKGNLWLNLREIDKVDSPLGRVISEMHRSFYDSVGVKAGSRIGGLLISSPTANVGYHFDATDVTLWHLRGRKRIYIYPNNEPFLSPKDVQSVVLAYGIEKIPYGKAYDEKATAIDLTPGDVICWPHLSPHRIDNQAGLNVSLSLESLTMASRLRIGAHFFDAYFNKMLKTNLRSTDPALPVAFAKTAVSTLIKRTGLHKAHHKKVTPGFNLNMDMPGCVEPISS